MYAEIMGLCYLFWEEDKQVTVRKYTCSTNRLFLASTTPKAQIAATAKL